MSQLVKFELRHEGTVETLGYNLVDAVPRHGEMVRLGPTEIYQVKAVLWETALFEKKEDMRGQFTALGLAHPTTAIIWLGRL